ncbi:hypothetical protein [Zunongwangia pacifica]|uniref:Secreted repeat protein with Y-X4-D motif n=1 Tax=Zunongwangia pacifica TaxID=2911062 RepID=A0A9X1ZUV6_9FLAO|nr:hypothetical protein [Zunongwangia pacifica]MCL6216791.1 hypothetical protein [Zunongwangia pacifica]
MKKLIFILTFAALFIQSCSSDDDAPQTITDPQENSATVSLTNNSKFGNILTDGSRRTLYFFSNDSKDNSTCTESCLSAWPVFYQETIKTDDDLDTNDFATITRPDGKKQTTYKGWPLYYYANDVQAGDINGDRIGEVWYVAKPDYSLMFVNAQLVGADGKNYIINSDNEYIEGEGLTKYLTDNAGNTLYAFSPDKKDTNNYTSEDFSNDAAWPIFTISLENLPSILKLSDFNTISVHNKREQLTYKGWPLYYFGGDSAKGDNKGVSVPLPGIWPIVNHNSIEAPEE